MKNYLLGLALLSSSFAMASLPETSDIVCGVTREDLKKMPVDPDFIKNLKTYSLKIGEKVEWTEIPGEKISIAFTTASLGEDITLQMHLKIDNYEIDSLADTRKGPYTRFGVSVSAPNKIMYNLDCGK